MSWKGNIEELNEKFWRGETTLEEDKMLQNYHHDSKDKNSIESAYFEFLDDQRNVIYAPQKKRGVVHMFRKNMVAIAAGMAVLIGSVVVFNTSNRKHNVYIASTPEEALHITQNTLAYIHSTVQHGNTVVFSNLEEFNNINFFK